MANKTKLFGLGIMLLALVGVSFATYTSTSSEWQPVVHNNNLNFQATYQNGVVNMTWNHFTPTSSNWKYRKVVRSTSKTNPIYPDDGYIKYDGNTNFVSYTDQNPPVGTVYYGVCAITSNSYGKYRNCDWQAVNVNGGSEAVACTMEYAPVCGVDGKTYSNKCMANSVKIKSEGKCGSTNVAPAPVPSNLSSSLKNAVDAMITKLLNNLENKFGDDRNSKVSLLETLSTKLDGIKVNYRLKPMITYLVEKIDEAVALLQIEALLNID